MTTVTKLGITGRTISKIDYESELLTLEFEDGGSAYWYDEEDGTGNDVEVWLEDLIGDEDDIIGEPLVLAEECSSDDVPEDSEDETWTFYRLVTKKGTVTLRFGGRSNGYYSESPAFKIQDRRRS